MALTKIGKEGITGISNSADATFLTATSGEGVTLAGTLAVTGVHTVGANAVATTGSTTTTVVQGLAKAFLAHKATNVIRIYDSNNIASVTDNGTGDETPNFTNNFNSGTDYACTAFGQQDSGGGGRIIAGKGTPATSNRQVTTVNTSNNVCDLLYFNMCYHGDLA